MGIADPFQYEWIYTLMTNINERHLGIKKVFVALKGHDRESVEAKAKKVSVIPNDVGRGSIRDR